jgi:hypothetical protein
MTIIVLETSAAHTDYAPRGGNAIAPAQEPEWPVLQPRRPTMVRISCCVGSRNPSKSSRRARRHRQEDGGGEGKFGCRRPCGAQFWRLVAILAVPAFTFTFFVPPALFEGFIAPIIARRLACLRSARRLAYLRRLGSARRRLA